MNTIKQAFLITALSLSNIAALNLLTAKQTLAADCSNFNNFLGLNLIYPAGCETTPSVYAIKVHKIGFCTANPLGADGTAPDFTNCTLTFQDTSGSPASFAAGTNITMPFDKTTPPALGTYQYAIIEASNSFTIKAELAILDENNVAATYRSTNNLDGFGRGSIASKVANSASEFTYPIKSFGNACTPAFAFNIGGAALTAKLLDANNKIIAAGAGLDCGAGVTKIIGVAQLTTPIRITPETKSCLASFEVTGNGASFTTTDVNNVGGNGAEAAGIFVRPGPFKVSFTIAE